MDVIKNLKPKTMTLQEIKSAVDKGVVVNWKNNAYVVRKDKDLKEYNVYCLLNDNIAGLTYKSDDNKCTHNLQDFYIKN